MSASESATWTGLDYAPSTSQPLALEIEIISLPLDQCFFKTNEAGLVQDKLQWLHVTTLQHIIQFAFARRRAPLERRLMLELQLIHG